MLLRCFLIMSILLIPAWASHAQAQTEGQRAENLATCLSGRYPILCKRQWLTPEDRVRVDEAERRENLKTCMTGRYPTLCKKGMLTSDELGEVVAAERGENLRTCMTGRYPTLCKRGLLTDAERKQVSDAEKAENLRTCLTGRYPSLCKHGMLTAEQQSQAKVAESQAKSETPPLTRTVERARSRASSGCEDGHWVESVSSDGSIVKLEDGSIWEVDAVDAIDAALWLPTTDIIACDDKLINTDDNEKVSARRLR